MSKNPAARKQTTPPSLHSQKDVNESDTGNNLSNQAKVIAFVDDPNTLKRATEGSMEKRQALLDRVADNNLEEILDSHAVVYARTTMQYITDEITEDERDKEWHHSDLKTKHAILTHYIKKSDVVDIVMGALLSEKVTITIPPQKLGEYQHIYQFSLSLRTLLITSGRLHEFEQALTAALKGKYSKGGSE